MLEFRSKQQNYFYYSKNGILTNAIEIHFQKVQLWGNITYIFISDGISAIPIYYDVLTVPRAVQSQTGLLFATGTMQIKMTCIGGLNVYFNIK